MVGDSRLVPAPAQEKGQPLPDLSRFVTVLDADFRYVAASDDYCKLVGFTREELLGTSGWAQSARVDGARQKAIEQLATTGVLTGRTTLVTRDGTRIPWENTTRLVNDFYISSGTPATDDDDEPVTHYGIPGIGIVDRLPDIGVSYDAAATIAKVRVRTIRRWHEKGYIEVGGTPGGARRVSLRSLQHYLTHGPPLVAIAMFVSWLFLFVCVLGDLDVGVEHPINMVRDVYAAVNDYLTPDAHRGLPRDHMHRMVIQHHRRRL